MKNVIAILAFVLVSQAHAQYGQQPDVVAIPVQPSQDAGLQANPTAGNQIYILNTQRTNAQARQGQVQEQPVTVVQEAPVRQSGGDAFRNRRKSEESATEDGIVQALERARLEDEVKRRDKFNNAIGAQNTAGATIVGDNNQVSQTQLISQPAVQAQIAPQVVAQEVTPVPVARPKQKIHLVNEAPVDDGPDIVVVDDRRGGNVRNEVRAAFDDYGHRDERKQDYYIGALAAFGNYDNVINVDRSMGWGLVIGTQLANRVVAEGTFTYANYELLDVYNYNSFSGGAWGGYNALTVDMRQMNFAAAAKYVILPGRFKPNAGVALSYTRRTYSNDFQADFRTTDAIDAGGVLGADLELGDNFSIGADFRYFTNLGFRQNLNRSQQYSYGQYRNDPETLDYYTINLMAKFLF